METLQRKSRFGSAEVAGDLRLQIRNEKLKSFDRLPSERILAQTYNVSRGTIREALTRLEEEGLVDIRAGSGTYVVYNGQSDHAAQIAGARPLELMDARFALEPHICRLAVLHARRPDFEAMELLINKMEANPNNPEVFAEADSAFHSALVESTGNNLLVWVIGQIKAVQGLDEWQRMRQLTLDKTIIAKYNQQHRRILDALRSREAERAATAMKDHLETARLSLTRAVDT